MHNGHLGMAGQAPNDSKMHFECAECNINRLQRRLGCIKTYKRNKYRFITIQSIIEEEWFVPLVTGVLDRSFKNTTFLINLPFVS